MMSLGLGLRAIRGAGGGDVVPPIPSEVLTFGNTTVSGTFTGSNAPNTRRLAVIGDSRMNGVGSGSFACEIQQNCGEWVWSNAITFNYALGGSSIYHARVTQAPAAVASGARCFAVLTGVNGAVNGNDAGQTPVNTLADRQSQMLGLLAVLDQVGATIFLCNDMAETPPMTQLHLDYHSWLSSLTTATAGLENATLRNVDTWGAVADPTTTGLATRFDPRFRVTGDDLHPNTLGQERMAYAVWLAMGAYFTTPCVNIYAPSNRLFKAGALTTNSARGGLPPAFRDYGAADGFTYTTTGVGPDWVIEIYNGSAITKTAGLRCILAEQTTDAVVMVDYELAVNPDPGEAARLYRCSMGGINWDFGTGVNAANTNMWNGAVGSTSREQWLGGRRRSTVLVGKTQATPRVDILFTIRAGQTVKIHDLAMYER